MRPNTLINTRFFSSVESVLGDSCVSGPSNLSGDQAIVVRDLRFEVWNSQTLVESTSNSMGLGSSQSKIRPMFVSEGSCGGCSFFLWRALPEIVEMFRQDTGVVLGTMRQGGMMTLKFPVKKCWHRKVRHYGRTHTRAGRRLERNARQVRVGLNADSCWFGKVLLIPSITATSRSVSRGMNLRFSHRLHALDMPGTQIRQFPTQA